ncbi:MAG: hypothetical protein ACRERE_00295 [Candidatus Entotheonellia bacterium]
MADDLRSIYNGSRNRLGNGAHAPIYGDQQLDLCYDRRDNGKHAWSPSALRESSAPVLALTTVQLAQTRGPSLYGWGRIALEAIVDA